MRSPAVSVSLLLLPTSNLVFPLIHLLLILSTILIPREGFLVAIAPPPAQDEDPEEWLRLLCLHSFFHFTFINNGPIGVTWGGGGPESGGNEKRPPLQVRRQRRLSAVKVCLPGKAGGNQEPHSGHVQLGQDIYIL